TPVMNRARVVSRDKSDCHAVSTTTATEVLEPAAVCSMFDRVGASRMWVSDCMPLITSDLRSEGRFNGSVAFLMRSLQYALHSRAAVSPPSSNSLCHWENCT